MRMLRPLVLVLLLAAAAALPACEAARSTDAGNDWSWLQYRRDP